MTTKCSNGVEIERTGKRTRATCLTHGFYNFRPCSGQENRVITLVDCIIQGIVVHISLQHLGCGLSTRRGTVRIHGPVRAPHIPPSKLP
jgi:hypothetical protein